jgi:hypothetical protein
MTEIWCWFESLMPPERVPYAQAMIAFLGFGLGILTFWFAKRREEFKLGTDLVLKLADRFGTLQMHQIRKCAAKDLSEASTDSANVDVVLDFFEELGFLLRRGAIDPETAYMFFSYTFWTYFYSTTVYRDLARTEKTQDVWRELETGYRMIERIDDFKQSGYRWRWMHNIAWIIRRRHDARERLGPDDDDEMHRALLEEITQPSWKSLDRISRLPRSRMSQDEAPRTRA